jgi:hypothetical protein
MPKTSEKIAQSSPGGKKALKKIAQSLRPDEAEKIKKDLEDDPAPETAKSGPKEILPLSDFNGLIPGIFFWGFDVWLKKQGFEKLTQEEKNSLQDPLNEIERLIAGYVAKHLSPAVCKYAGQISPFVPLVLEVRMIVAARISARVAKVTSEAPQK